MAAFCCEIRVAGAFTLAASNLESFIVASGVGDVEGTAFCASTDIVIAPTSIAPAIEPFIFDNPLPPLMLDNRKAAALNRFYLT